MSNSPLSAAEIRAAAEVQRELGPDYSDAVLESFLAKVDSEIAARVDAHLASAPPVRRRQIDPAGLRQRRTLVTGMAIGAAAVGVPISFVADSMGGSAGGPLLLVWAVVTVIFAAAAFWLRRPAQDG
jgi:hypothetical protein